MKEEELLKAFYALSDPVRLGIIKILLDCKELCVCQITEAFKLSQPNASFHLRILKEANLVICEKRGKWNYYKVNAQNELINLITPLIENMPSRNLPYSYCEVNP